MVAVAAVVAGVVAAARVEVAAVVVATMVVVLVSPLTLLQAFRNSSNSLHFETHFSLSITAESPHEPQILLTSSNGRKQKWEQFISHRN